VPITLKEAHVVTRPTEKHEIVGRSVRNSSTITILLYAQGDIAVQQKVETDLPIYADRVRFKQILL
jgi:hypothetical protein